MALAVSKQLHVHVVPFLVVTVGFLIGTTLLCIVLSAHSTQPLPELLGVRLYDIQPSSNGLARISRHSSAPLPVPTIVDNKLGGAGQSASLQAAVYAR